MIKAINQDAPASEITKNDLIVDEIQFGGYTVMIGLQKCFDRQQSLEMIRDQFAIAEQRGLTPDQDSLLFIRTIDDDQANMAGGFCNLNGEIQDLSKQANEIVLNYNTFHKDSTAEHELWHAIDYMGNHSGIRQMEPVSPDLELVKQSQQAMVTENFHKESYSHGFLYRLIAVKLDQVRAYANHPAEWFVHENMCKTRGLEPGTFEGYLCSHRFLDAVLHTIEVLLDEGVPRNTCRKIWQRYFWNSIVNTRPRWRQELDDLGYKWLLRK